VKGDGGGEDKEGINDEEDLEVHRIIA
jgi:hypothetical protein